MYQPRPEFTPNVSAIVRVTKAVGRAMKMPSKMLGRAAGRLTLSTRNFGEAPNVWHTSK